MAMQYLVVGRALLPTTESKFRKIARRVNYSGFSRMELLMAAAKDR